MPIKAIFARETGAGFLLCGLAALSALSIALDTTTRLLHPAREFLTSVASPVYFIAEAPYLLGSASDEYFTSQDQLRSENQQLRQQILRMSEMSQQNVALRAENDRLRKLLRSQGKLSYEVLIAELVGVVPNPNTFQVIIDKGADAGIVAGQAVLDAQGLFGQVVEVGEFTSRVLLISDADHAVPVQVNRNGVRSIAGGTGKLDQLELENVPVSADIIEGDLIETSGLGGRFPAGYPVGLVQSVVVEPTSTYAQVSVQPTALLDRSRHVLVIFKPSPQIEDELVEELAQEVEEGP